MEANLEASEVHLEASLAVPLEAQSPPPRRLDLRAQARGQGQQQQQKRRNEAPYHPEAENRTVEEVQAINAERAARAALPPHLAKIPQPPDSPTSTHTTMSWPDLPVPDVGADLLDYMLTAADSKLDKIYGDHVHNNPSTHLTGGIADGAPWQCRWKWIVNIRPSQYLVPQNCVGKMFLQRFCAELQGVHS